MRSFDLEDLADQTDVAIPENTDRFREKFIFKSRRRKANDTESSKKLATRPGLLWQDDVRRETDSDWRINFHDTFHAPRYR